MGAGSSLEAAYSLRAPIPAGTWRLVADGIVLEAADVSFELLRRSGSSDTELAAFSHHFDPLPGGEYRAQPYEATAAVGDIEPAAGEELVFRYSADSASLPMAYIPNGDGELTGGRIPFLELPR